LLAVVALLGLLNLAWGFLKAYNLRPPIGIGSPVLATAGAYAPVLLLVAGLLALGAFLPGGRRHDYQVAVLSIAGIVGAAATFLLAQPPLGIGAILVLVTGLIQALVAIGALLVGLRATRQASRESSPTGGASAPAFVVPRVSRDLPVSAPPQASAPPQGSPPWAPSTPGTPDRTGWVGPPPTPDTPPAMPPPPASAQPPDHAASQPARDTPRNVSEGDDPEATRIMPF
jgi:hypothetical protein